jgi:asparagine synthase (glutamine-hydrolysing)
MCGIAGIVKPNLDTEKYSLLVRGMIQKIAHRGPDAQTSYTGNDFSFGHARLSIVDLVDGKQPMKEADLKNVIVFNGEIYGYKNIKSNYADYKFVTQSDTELLLAMYQRNGEKMLDELPGMFAFSIWDEKNKKLFAARDRFGEKPFYYAIGKNGEFVFASEMKAILSTGLVEPGLDTSSVDFYLRRLYVHPHKTIFKNIFTLPAAHALSFENGKIKTWRYWNLPELNHLISFEEAKGKFTQLLDTAVQNQLVADVPLAAFLSGGLDSSTIVAIASKYKNNLTTFSFGFEGDKSELKYAEQIAKKYKTNHVILEEKKFDIAELLAKMHSIYDEPFADSSNIPTYLISKLASKHVKVVLTGDACDELMAGYNFWYRRIYEFEKAKDSSRVNFYFAMLMRSMSYRLKLKTQMRYQNQVAGFADAEKFSSASAIHEQQRNFFSAAQASSLFIKPVAGVNSESNLNTLNEILRDDVGNYMPGDILVKTDRASMANSLELRAPFLDRDFASFCISLPINFKINDNTEKLLLREACGELWTEQIRHRKKQGFAASVNEWLKIPSIVALKEKYLQNKNNKIFSVLKYDAVSSFYKRDDMQTWALLNLSMWMENYEFTVE